MSKVGQLLMNVEDGIIGTFLREFRATGFGDITIVKTLDGREYKAPSDEWKSTEELREILIESMFKNGRTSEVTIYLSQELDKIIVIEQKKEVGLYNETR